MRSVNIGSKRFSEVFAVDSPGLGNACHEYRIMAGEQQKSDVVARIEFQKGSVQESGVNGCFIEDLLAIVIDRLQGFQGGEFACRENALALTKIQEAMHWLNHRTKDRQERGVEGKLVK